MYSSAITALAAFITLAIPAIAAPNVIVERGGWHKMGGDATTTVTATQAAVAAPAPITLATVAAGQPMATMMTVAVAQPMATMATMPMMEGDDDDDD